MGQKDQEAQLVVTPTAGAAGTSDITSAEVDMQNFESVEFLVPVGAVVAAGVQSIKAQQDVVTGMAGAADLLGTNIAIADDDDNTLFRLEIIKPLERFVRIVIPRATQNATIGGVIAMKSGPKNKPITEHTLVTTAESHVSPIEGTA